ncbi:hypothetical protein ScPMuIL_005126 [Solemya velum]
MQPRDDNMALNYISFEDIQKVLNFKNLIPCMESALAKFSNKTAVQPVRAVARIKDKNGFLAAMPAVSPEDGAIATKVLTFFPENKNCPTHHAIIIVFNPETGIPEVLMDGDVITTMRTAAVSAVATKYLCTPHPRILAILGAGVQGESHYHALTSTFEFTQVRIWSRTTENSRKLAEKVGAITCQTAEEAVCDADVIVTATSAQTPILKSNWVKPGVHINAVGACCPDWQEIEPELMRSSVVYTDSREAALRESGDVVISQAAIFAELGEVVIGQKEAQRTKTTIFKSLGMAIEDVLSARLVCDLLAKADDQVKVPVQDRTQS